jgi:hypothetical protein
MGLGMPPAAESDPNRDRWQKRAGTKLPGPLPATTTPPRQEPAVIAKCTPGAAGRMFAAFSIFNL